MRILFILLCIATATTTVAQNITLNWIELSGDKVIVHYDLDDVDPRHEYQVNLLSSRDKFAEPLKKVSGDVEEVRPGKDKKIIWDVTKELGAFKGSLTFEVRARVFVPFVKLTTFDQGKVFKRGKNYPLVWTSGSLGGQVNIELYDANTRVFGENNIPNSGKHEWYIPGNVKKGNNYHLRFTNTKNRNDYVNSAVFSIRPRIPFIAKLAGIAVVGTGVTLLALSGGGTDPDPLEEDNTLPSNPGKPK